MPTAKPRITLTLEPHTYEVLSRLSAAGGDSMSQLVASLVDLAVPSMERMVVLLERAKAAPAEARAGFAAAVERADRDLIPLLEKALGQTDLFISDLESVAAGAPVAAGGSRLAASRPAEPAVGGSTPVPVTRGSGGSKGAPAGAKGGAGSAGGTRPPGRLFSDDEAKAIVARVAGNKGSKRG